MEQQRPHDGIVFHSAYQHMIRWSKQSGDQSIQSMRDIESEGDVPAVGCAEKHAQFIPASLDSISGFVRPLITTPANVDRIITKKSEYGFRYFRSLRKRCRPVVQIDRLHIRRIAWKVSDFHCFFQ
jgi:hypothetical protein